MSWASGIPPEVWHLIAFDTNLLSPADILSLSLSCRNVYEALLAGANRDHAMATKGAVWCAAGGHSGALRLCLRRGGLTAKERARVIYFGCGSEDFDTLEVLTAELGPEFASKIGWGRCVPFRPELSAAYFSRLIDAGMLVDLEAFPCAAAYGAEDVALMFLDRYEDETKSDRFKTYKLNPAFRWACQLGLLRLYKACVARGVDPYHLNDICLWLAASEGRAEIVREYITSDTRTAEECGLFYGNALQDAIDNDHTETAEILHADGRAEMPEPGEAGLAFKAREKWLESQVRKLDGPGRVTGLEWRLAHGIETELSWLPDDSLLPYSVSTAPSCGFAELRTDAKSLKMFRRNYQHNMFIRVFIRERVPRFGNVPTKCEEWFMTWSVATGVGGHDIYLNICPDSPLYGREYFCDMHFATGSFLLPVAKKHRNRMLRSFRR